MSLDEQEAIWGINLANAKDYGSLRQYLNFIVLGICIIVALSVISIMNSNTITIGNYMSTMLLLGLVFYAIHDACHRNKLYRVYCFYRRYKRCEGYVFQRKTFVMPCTEQRSITYLSSVNYLTLSILSMILALQIHSMHKRL